MGSASLLLDDARHAGPVDRRLENVMNELLSQMGIGQIVLAVVAVQMLAVLVAVLLCRAGGRAAAGTGSADPLSLPGLLAA